MKILIKADISTCFLFGALLTLIMEKVIILLMTIINIFRGEWVMRKILKGLLVTTAVMVFSLFRADTVDVVAANNLEAAKTAYGTSKVIENESFETLQDDLFEAALRNSSDTSPCIVYVPGGRTYTVTSEKAHNKEGIKAGYASGIFVPENVILVAEDSTVFSANPSGKMQRLVMVCGSVYGGTYKGNNKCDFVVQFRNNTTFETIKSGSRQVDGNIEKTIVSGAKACGIKGIGTKNVNIRYNTVTDCRTRSACGIGVSYGAKANQISRNTIKNVGAGGFGSGIDVTHANVNYIEYNTISGAAGHGISTDTDQKPLSKTKQNYCKIYRIKGNVISNSTGHGIWLENRSQITSTLLSNTIKNGKKCGIAVEANSKYAGSNQYSINAMTQNQIYNNAASNISVSGKYGKIRLTKNNVIKGSKKQIGIVADKYAKVYITGANNKITGNKSYGIYLKNRSNLSVTSTGRNYIQSNQKYAIGLYNKSKAVVKNMTLTGNKKGTAYIGKGSSLRYSRCKTAKIVKGTTL